MRKCEECGTEMIPMVLPGSGFCPNDCDRKDRKEPTKAEEDDALFVPPSWSAIGLPSPTWWYSTQASGTVSSFSGITATNVPWWGSSNTISPADVSDDDDGWNEEVDGIIDDLDDLSDN